MLANSSENVDNAAVDEVVVDNGDILDTGLRNINDEGVTIDVENVNDGNVDISNNVDNTSEGKKQKGNIRKSAEENDVNHVKNDNLIRKPIKKSVENFTPDLKRLKMHFKPPPPSFEVHHGMRGCNQSCLW